MRKATTELVPRFALHKFQRKGGEAASCLASRVGMPTSYVAYAFNMLGLNSGVVEQVVWDGKFSIPSILLKFFHSYSENNFELARF